MREYEGHIGHEEGIVLVFTLLAAMLFFQFPQFLVEVGGPAGWQVATLVTAIGLILVLPMGGLARRFPGRGLAEISVVCAGPVLGPLMTLAVCGWIFASAVSTLRNFTETFIMAILPDTPPSVLMAVAVACAVYASYKGLEAIARSTQILLPLIAAGVLLVLGFSLPRVDLSLLYPFWGHGLLATLSGGLYYGSMAAETLVLLVLGYGFRSARNLVVSGAWGIVLFGIGSVATTLVLVGVLGAPTASQIPFPLVNLARLVYLGRFLQRTEAIIVMFWFFAAAARLSVLLHGAAVSLSGALRLPAYRPILFPLAVLLFSLSLLPKDFVTALRLERDWVRPFGFAVQAVPLLLWLLAAVRGKGAPADAA